MSAALVQPAATQMRPPPPAAAFSMDCAPPTAESLAVAAGVKVSHVIQMPPPEPPARVVLLHQSRPSIRIVPATETSPVACRRKSPPPCPPSAPPRPPAEPGQYGA